MWKNIHTYSAQHLWKETQFCYQWENLTKKMKSDTTEKKSVQTSDNSKVHSLLLTFT
jgi:hypothetical protein